MADDINLTDRTPAPGLRAVRDRWCSHQRMSVNANARRLTCDGCGAELDPYKALATIAHNSEKVRQWSDAATLAAKRLNEIERRERNARARLKNLGEEVPAKNEIEEELCGKLSAWIEDTGGIMAKPKPKRPYHIINCNGQVWGPLLSLRWGREALKDYDAEFPECAPHRIYVLVTLEEQRVIRAAKKLVKSWDSYDPDEIGLRAGLEETLAKAVEAARGK